MKSEQHSADGASAASSSQERRHHARYRFSEPLNISREDGSTLAGISVEISKGGMSAMVNGLLRAGETVAMEPVVGGRTSAVVRHKLGQLYGFEFVEITADQVRQISEKCKKSNLWRNRGEARGCKQ